MNVSFTFDGTCEMRLPAASTVFPFGGGMGVEEIVLGPLDLSGLTDAEVRAAIVKRVGDLARRHRRPDSCLNCEEGDRAIPRDPLRTPHPWEDDQPLRAWLTARIRRSLAGRPTELGAEQVS